MKNRIWMVILFSCFCMLLAACPDKEQERVKEASKPQEQETGTETEKETGTNNDQVKGNEIEEINAIKEPSTIEEFKAMSPGLLTKDFSYEKETAMWPALNPLEEIKEPFEQQITSFINEERDTDILFKSLIYYLGNSAYSKVVDELTSMTPKFDEPYLPGPEDIEKTVHNEKQKAPSKAIILLDASSSMLLQVDGKQKMEVAKDAVRRFAKTVGQSSQVSLLVYGHEGSQADKDKQLSCSKIEEVYPLQNYNEESFFNSVKGIEAKGWTPLAGAIKKAREQSKAMDGDITLYIVSDGAETCDGNPIKEAKEFAVSKSGHKVNIIGFDVDKKAENQLKEVAKAGKGEYITADNMSDLNTTITERWVPSFLDIIGKQWESPKNSFSIMWQKMDIDKATMNINYAVNQEHQRFVAAINLLKSEKMIDDQQGQGLMEKATAYKERLNAMTSDLSRSKKKDIDDEVDRIDTKIKDWVKRMEKIRKENGSN